LAGSVNVPGAAASPVTENVDEAAPAAGAGAQFVPQFQLHPIVHGKPTSTPIGYTPAQVKHAYGFDRLPTNTKGSGVAIAVVDPYDDPNIQSDLNTFSKQFNLPVTTITKVFPQGTPAPDAISAQEISLDVECMLSRLGPTSSWLNPWIAF
jgi:subtilase family serine protease